MMSAGKFLKKNASPLYEDYYQALSYEPPIKSDHRAKQQNASPKASKVADQYVIVESYHISKQLRQSAQASKIAWTSDPNTQTSSMNNLRQSKINRMKLLEQVEILSQKNNSRERSPTNTALAKNRAANSRKQTKKAKD